MVYCVAYGCTNNSKKQNPSEKGRKRLQFFCFPKDPVLLARWVDAVQRLDPKTGERWTPGPHSRLCSDHFKGESLNFTYNSPRLRSDAVPTVFNFIPPENGKLKKVVRRNGNCDDAEDSGESYQTDGVSLKECSVVLERLVLTELNDNLRVGKNLPLVKNSLVDDKALVASKSQTGLLSCCVPNCSTLQRMLTKPVGKTHPSITYHWFPNHPETRRKWLNVLKDNTLDTSNCGDASVCSSHFKRDDFFWCNGCRQLKPDAVPSVKLPLGEEVAPKSTDGEPEPDFPSSDPGQPRTPDRQSMVVASSFSVPPVNNRSEADVSRLADHSYHMGNVQDRFTFKSEQSTRACPFPQNPKGRPLEILKVMLDGKLYSIPREQLPCPVDKIVSIKSLASPRPCPASRKAEEKPSECQQVMVDGKMYFVPQDPMPRPPLPERGRRSSNATKPPPLIPRTAPKFGTDPVHSLPSDDPCGETSGISHQPAKQSTAKPKLLSKQTQCDPDPLPIAYEHFIAFERRCESLDLQLARVKLKLAESKKTIKCFKVALKRAKDSNARLKQQLQQEKANLVKEQVACKELRLQLVKHIPKPRKPRPVKVYMPTEMVTDETKALGKPIKDTNGKITTFLVEGTDKNNQRLSSTSAVVKNVDSSKRAAEAFAGGSPPKKNRGVTVESKIAEDGTIVYSVKSLPKTNVKPVKIKEPAFQTVPTYSEEDFVYDHVNSPHGVYGSGKLAQNGRYQSNEELRAVEVILDLDRSRGNGYP